MLGERQCTTGPEQPCVILHGVPGREGPSCSSPRLFLTSVFASSNSNRYVVSPCGKKAGLFFLLQEHSIPQAQSLFPISQPTVCTGIHEGPFANYDQRYRTAKKQTTTKN